MADKRGGKREGAGRKPYLYLNLREEIMQRDPKAIDTFVEYLLANYMEDSKLMIWVGEHIFGKPQQNIDVTTLGKELPQPIMHVVPDNDSDK